MGAVAAIVMMKEREVVEAFERGHATSVESARPLDTLGIDTDGLGLRRLRNRAVIREARPGEFYLDVEVWQAVRRQRQRVAFVLMLIIAIVLAGGIIARLMGRSA